MKKRPVKKIAVLLFVVICLSISLTALADKLVFVVPMMVTSKPADGAKAGVTDNASSFLQRICDIIKKKTGDDAECAVVNKPNDAMLSPANTKKYIQAIENKNYAAMYISGNDYYALTASGYDKTIPAVQISFKKKTADQICIYARSTDNIKTVQDLKGKTWAGSYYYMGTRYILYKNGVDMPLKKFFGKTVLEPDDFWVNSADMLVEGKTDAFTGALEEELMGRTRDTKKYAVVKPVLCVPYRSTHMIAFNKENMSKEKMVQIRNILLNAHKDKDFGTFQFIFTIIDGHFVPFDENAFKLSKEYVDTYTNRGWLKEQTAFIAGK